MRRIVVGIMGAGEHASAQALDWGRRLGELVAAQGWVLLTGGRDAGVMAAASAGAAAHDGLVIGVVPGSDTTHVADGVDVAIVTDMGSARNAINVLSSDVVIACGVTGAGTLSEVALAIKAGRPVILLSEDDEAQRFLGRVGGGLVHDVRTPDEAIRTARQLVEAARRVSGRSAGEGASSSR